MFYECRSLERISIPSSVTLIGESAFEGCRSLSKVWFHNGLKEISRGAFSSCTNLQSVTIPSTVIGIYDNAFKDCGKICVTIENSSKNIRISKNAFPPQTTVRYEK